jgi:PPOX class probable F420-dependent enzyme
MRTDLTLDDVADLVASPIVATLATYRRDGSILLSPVWYELREGTFRIWTGGWDEGKVSHLRADPRASLVIPEQTPPWRGVEAAGPVELTEDDFAGTRDRTAERYQGAETVAGLARTVPTGVIIRLHPERLRIWSIDD